MRRTKLALALALAGILLAGVANLAFARPNP